MPLPENPTLLFSEFKVHDPQEIPYENGCRKALEPFGIPLPPKTPFSQILTSFLLVFINCRKGLLENPLTSADTRHANNGLLANEMNISIQAQEAEAEIQRLYEQNIDPDKIAAVNTITAEELAVIALKLALDYAHANCPKIKLGEQREDFLPVSLSGAAELVIANTLEIFLYAEEQGVNIEKYVQLLKQLQIDLWRSESVQLHPSSQ
ncbi:MAG: hypothetical protein WC882_00590 [Candidatus Gracilibacteria bacterium]